MEKGKKLAEGRTAVVYEWEDDRVIKLFHQGWSRTSINHEYKIARAVQNAGLDVPHAKAIVTHDNQTGIVYERLEGSSMLHQFQVEPLGLVKFARQMANLHLDIHAKVAHELPDRHEILQRRITNTELDDEAKEKLLAYLEKLPRGNSLLHNDYHPDNILITPQGGKVIDWIDAATGHPMADVARTVLILSQGELPPGISSVERILLTAARQIFLRIYTRTYFKNSPHALEDMQVWLPVITAARLADGITEEKKRLIADVKKYLRDM